MADAGVEAVIRHGGRSRQLDEVRRFDERREPAERQRARRRNSDRPGRVSYSHATSPPKRAKSSKLAIAFALSVLFAVWAAVAWRLWLTDRVIFEGPLREGSLRCDDACHFDFVVEAYGGTRVRAETCIMPDALRDWPGRPVHAMIAGTWEGQRRFKATALFVRSDGVWPAVKQRPVSSITGAEGGAATGRPPACFVPPARP